MSDDESKGRPRKPSVGERPKTSLPQRERGAAESQDRPRKPSVPRATGGKPEPDTGSMKRLSQRPPAPARDSVRPPAPDSVRPPATRSVQRPAPVRAHGVERSHSDRPPARPSERPPGHRPSGRPPAPGEVRSSHPPAPMRDHLGNIIEMGEGIDGRQLPEPSPEWPRLQRAQAAAVLVALLLEAVLPTGWVIALVAAGCLGFSLQRLPQSWGRPGPMGLAWRLVLTRALLTVLLPAFFKLGGPWVTLVAALAIALLAGLAPILVDRTDRPHHLELARCMGTEVDAMALAVLACVLHASDQVGTWVLFAGGLRYLHVIALIATGTDMNRERGPAAFFLPLMLLVLASGLLPMPLLYVPLCALATIATTLVFGRLTLRHAA